jgi:hypothetical protein
MLVAIRRASSARNVRPEIRRERSMSDAAKTGSAQAEWMRRLAVKRGLGRAFAMYPETVTAAFARASQCMSTCRPTCLR